MIQEIPLLFLGDCTKKMNDLSGESIDLTVTSPPYDNLRTYNGNNDQWGEYVWRLVIHELYRVTKNGGVVVWIVGDATVNGSETGTSFKQALFFKETGFNIHDTMIWNKNSFSAVGSLKSRYAPVFEYMFVLSKGNPKTFNPIKDRRSKKFGVKPGGTVRVVDGSMRQCSNPDRVVSEYGQRFNVWDHPPFRGRSKHPAAFPHKLVEDLILSWSNEGDIVFDPFMGSGTTGVVAQRLLRNFIGIEIDPTYFGQAWEAIFT